MNHFSIHCSNSDLSKDFMFEFKKLPDGDFGLEKVISMILIITMQNHNW